MDDFSSQINEKLVPSTSNETLNCNSTVGSLEDVYNTNQLVKHCDSVPSEYSEPSVFSCNQSFDKFEVKQSKDVHIGTSYHCSSVHVYEAVPSNISEIKFNKK